MKKQKSRNRLERIVLCQCDCGSSPISVKLNDVRTGSVKSCGCMTSYGEYLAKSFLNILGIKYKTQYYFKDLYRIKGHYLKFDFAILDNKDNVLYLIEIDGSQHEQDTKYLWENCSYEDCLERDEMKNKYCYENNIPLIRIPSHRIKNLRTDDLILKKSKYVYKYRAIENPIHKKEMNNE